MKILAIRGRNLASLADEFEIDFTEAPLAERGLFAITGPTGVGKSTLLDALCLALFDTAPRLDFGRGPEIGRGDEDGDWLKSNDVRSLLRRGAVDGYAEVDFVGRDGRALRATWSVGRARSRKDGKLQPQTVSLVDLATKASLGGTKTDTLKAIEAQLGLSFAQFRKSVLLAQGEFAEFLKADANERSQLLQRITGTEVYERISKAAHQKVRDVKDQIEAKVQILAGIVVLDDAERAELERAETDAAGKVKTAVAREKRLEEVGRRAATAKASATAAEAKAKEARTAAQEASAATEQARAAREAVGGGERALDGARTAREARREEIARARELDVRLEGARASAKEAWRRQEEAERLAVEARAELEASRAVEEAARQERDRIEGWLRDHEALRPVSEKWEGWSRSLDELVRTAGELAEAGRRLERASAAVALAEKEVRELEARVADQATRLESATAERKEAEARLAGIPAADHRARLEVLAAAVEALAALQGVRDRAGEAAAARNDAERKEASARVEAARAAAAEAEARKALEAVEASLSEARRALSTAEAAQELTGRRADLVEGEPCPLCGATEHPWATAGAPLDAAVQTFRERVSDLDRQAKALNAEAGREGATARAEGRAATEEKERFENAVARLAGLFAEWTKLVAKVASEPGPAVPAGPLDADAKETVAVRVAAAKDEQARLTQALREADRLASKAKQLLEGEEKLRAEAERVRTETGEAARVLHAATRARDTAKVVVSSLEEAEARELGSLRPILTARPELEAIARTRPEEVHRALRSEAEAFATTLAAAENAREAVARAGSEAGSRLSVVGEREAQVKKLQPETSRSREEAARLATERDGLLGGRPVAVVERELEGAVAAAEKELGEARQRSEMASAAVAASEEKARGAAAVRDESAEAARRASEALAGAMAEAGLEGTDPSAVDAVIGEASRAVEEARDRVAALAARRLQDDANRARRIEAQADLVAARKASEVWVTLDQLLGSADGAKFRKFAQSLTLEALVASTNVHLHDLARRYRLERVPKTEMELQVVDGAMGDEARSVNSLSGGETFLVSLALALGLSSLATRGTRVESLFIDEGFGSLDSESLDRALSVLDGLQATGRRIGVISHVRELVERIGVRVEVSAEGNGRSRVSVLSG